MLMKKQPFLSILDIGHGNSAVLVDEEGVVVIDAGPGSGLMEFLDRENIRRIDVVLISHADKDHIEGLIALLSAGVFGIGKVRLNTDSIKESRLWDDLVYELSKNNQQGRLDFVVSLTTKDTGLFNQGIVNIEILAPTLYLAAKGPGSQDRKGRLITTNSISAVVRLSVEGYPLALFPGDLDEVGLANLLDDGRDIYAPLLIFPHHGGLAGAGEIEVFAERLCELTKPSTVIFSIGRNKFQNPQPDIIFSIRRSLPDARIICTQLSKHCAKDLNSYLPRHLTDKFSSGKEHNLCCSGTIVVDLSRRIDVTLFPSLDEHHRFIEETAPTGLCIRPLPM